MNGPRDYLNKARAMRKASSMPRPAPATPIVPVPAPLPAQSPIPGPEPALSTPSRRVVPQPIGGHAIYRELMRSHDRMGTRHLGQG